MSEIPQKVGIVAGNFDVLHPGYIYMLKEAKQVCDIVIVALHTDPTIERPDKIKPILDVKERHEILSAIKYVDSIITYTTEKELLSIIVDMSPDVRLLGDDYKVRFDYTGCGLCPEVHYFDRSHGWSTTRFKNLIYKQMKTKRRKK
jgi:glycerol-3-phosphate cytidylyltransferase